MSTNTDSDIERTSDGLPVPGDWYLAFREMASLSFQNDDEDATIRVFWDLEDQEKYDEIVYEVSVTKRVSVLDETPEGDPENLKRVLEGFMLEVEDGDRSSIADSFQNGGRSDFDG